MFHDPLFEGQVPRHSLKQAMREWLAAFRRTSVTAAILESVLRALQFYGILFLSWWAPAFVIKSYTLNTSATPLDLFALVYSGGAFLFITLFSFFVFLFVWSLPSDVAAQRRLIRQEQEATVEQELQTDEQRVKSTRKHIAEEEEQKLLTEERTEDRKRTTIFEHTREEYLNLVAKGLQGKVPQGVRVTEGGTHEEQEALLEYYRGEDDLPVTILCTAVQVQSSRRIMLYTRSPAVLFVAFAREHLEQHVEVQSGDTYMRHTITTPRIAITETKSFSSPQEAIAYFVTSVGKDAV